MKETMKGLSIKDYNDIDLNGLTEIAALDNQLLSILKNSMDSGLNISQLDLYESTKSHMDYTLSVIEKKIDEMERLDREFNKVMNEPVEEVHNDI